jgi:hypothetical protein
MKTKLFLQTPAAIIILLASLAASAQPAAQFDPSTGLPVASGTPIDNPAAGWGPAPSAIDPRTGLPVAQAEPQWIDPGWSDPNIMLTNVSWDGLPLSEVVRVLRERFGKYFDILPMPHTFDKDWGSEISIQLQLKDVKASDIFNAMNMVFENDRTPVRWELKANASGRPVALLRVLPEAAPTQQVSQNQQQEFRRVFFVGDLSGNGKADAKEAQEQLLKVENAIAHVWEMTGASPDDLNKHLQIYAPGQLIIISGTHEQMDLAQQTLQALKKKSELEQTAAEPAPKSNEPKPGDSGLK